MEVRLFGPVEVRVAGRLLDLGPPQRRLLMSVFAVHAGRPLPVEALIDRLWGDDPPAGARRAVHAHVARIRRALERSVGPGDGPTTLDRRSGGYVLDVQPDRIDVHRFRRLLESSRQPGAMDRDRRRVLREALALWRGDPLSGLAGDWAARTREGWRQDRLEAVLRWAAAELSGGDPVSTIGPLTDLAGEYPLVEPVTAALMRTLHAAGRTAEALDRYVAVRLRLVNELGVEPGAELRATQRAILAGAPAEPAGAPVEVAAGSPVEAAPSAPAGQADTASTPQLEPAGELANAAPGGAYTVPAQLPLDVPGFTCRDDDLAQLDRLLDGARAESTAVTVAVLSGMAGVGKSSLAVHWAHRVRQHFPDGQLYVDLRGWDPSGPPAAPPEVIRDLLDALNVPSARIPGSRNAQVSLYRSVLADRRILLLLDNASDASQVRPLLPGSPGPFVVVTSRSDLAGLVATEGARPVPVDPLPAADARRLLAGRIGTVQAAAEPAAVEDLLRHCAGLPLALVLVAARAATRARGSLRELAAELGQAGQGLAAFDVGDPLTNLRAVFEQSYRILRPDAAALFRLLGSLPRAEHGVGALASAAALPVDRTRALLIELTGAHLVDARRPDHYSLHDLLRGYSAELAGEHDADWRRAGLHRMLDHYLHVAHGADRALDPHRDPIPIGPVPAGVQSVEFATGDAALAWFSAEWRVVVAVVAAAGELGFDEHVWQLARAVAVYLDRTGRWMEQLAAYEAGLAATQRLGDRPQQGRLHRYLGGAYLRLGRTEDGLAQLRTALELNRELGNRAGEAHTHQSLGWALRGTDLAGALRHVDQAYRLYQEIDDVYGQAGMLNDISWYQAQRGNLQEALRPARTAIRLFRQLGAVKDEADAWDTLGYVQLHLGYHRAAVHCLQRALRGHRAAAERDGELAALDHLGDAHDAAGEQLAAAGAWQAAAAIADELMLPDGSRIRAKLAGLQRPPTRPTSSSP